MSRRHRKLTLLPRPVGLLEFPAADDPELPGLVPLDRLSGRPTRWPIPAATLHSPGPALHLRHRAATDIGQRRDNNEDAYLADPALGLFVVCDGVGGRAFGEIASSQAASRIHEFLRLKAATLAAATRRTRDEVTVARLGALVRDAMQGASRELRSMARAQPRYTGMSTTASVVVIADDLAVIGQVGDSRVYLRRGASIHQLTEDHTLRNLQRRQGLSPGPDHGRPSPLVRVLGREDDVEVDVAALTLAAHDRLLLCSDGLHGYLDDDDALHELFELDLDAAVTAAIDHANRCGGEDNITALFVELCPAP